MKDLKTLLEGSLLADVEDTIKSGDKYSNFNLNTLMNAKSYKEFVNDVKLFKSMAESDFKGPFTDKQLKKGKSYIYIWQDSWSENDYIVCFVDKYPIQDPYDNLIDNAYYDIHWSNYHNKAMCYYDNTGNDFSNVLQQDFNGDTMKDAYEMPKEFFKSMKELIKNAESY